MIYEDTFVLDRTTEVALTLFVFVRVTFAKGSQNVNSDIKDPPLDKVLL